MAFRLEGSGRPSRQFPRINASKPITPQACLEQPPEADHRRHRVGHGAKDQPKAGRFVRFVVHRGIPSEPRRRSRDRQGAGHHTSYAAPVGRGSGEPPSARPEAGPEGSIESRAVRLVCRPSSPFTKMAKRLAIFEAWPSSVLLATFAKTK